MADTPLFDMSKAQSIPQPTQQPATNGAPLFDMSKAQPITSAPSVQGQAPSEADSGVLAGIKRNTLGVIAGLHDAFTRPADANEQAVVSAAKVNPTLAGVPEPILLAAHRLLVAPAEQTGQQAANTARRALASAKSGQYGEAAGQAADAAATGALAVVPMLGPWINSVANRATGVGVSGAKERPADISGAATDVAFGVGLENVTHIYDPETGTIRALPEQLKPSEITAKIPDLQPEWLTEHPEVPKPQHGSPVKVVSPLDRPTIDNLKGGPDLTTDAARELQKHAQSVGLKPGEEVQVGSSPENTLHKLSAPVQKTLTDAGAQMNAIIAKAQPFETSITEDATLDETLDAIRDNFPAADEEKLNTTMDKELQSADDVLRSKSPSEVLAYRRKLGNQIDWNNITRNPDTPGQVQNLARVEIYAALGDKLKAEIPEIIPIDKTFENNLQLQRFLDRNGVDRDPTLATAEHQSEFDKGRQQLEVQAHNAQVAKNWQRIRAALGVLGVGGGAYYLGSELLKKLAGTD